ncbi:hypothetical protein Tsubulata_039307 [Turnera subulata]|uniref:anthocyanidin 3-O-glucosyltransferase n=1 Tax=Turnera subulata TaxID=218843 RepID=A0A9Q0G654_9ROSI|nr:hypothetical protein Tsubulata_039307 [Turnera subulata]
MSSKAAHIVLYSVPAFGHFLAMTDFADQLLTRGLTVTLLITPNYLHLLHPLSSRHGSSQLRHLLLPNPPPAKGLLNYLTSLHEDHSPIILDWLQSHTSPPVTAIVSDFFAGWAQQLAHQVGVPHLAFSPSGAFGFSILASMWREKTYYEDPDDMHPVVSFDELPNSPSQLWWQMCQLYRESKKEDPNRTFFKDSFLANLSSWGIVFNSFSELERVYLDHIKEQLGNDRVWAVGPLLPLGDDTSSRGGSSAVPSHELLAWLDGKRDDCVVYISFGSGAKLTPDLMGAVTAALEKSGVSFIWPVKPLGEKYVSGDHSVLPEGFEGRVGERGLIIRGWAPQVTILGHRAVGTFLTHCGWNSVLEAITVGGVVMLTWPLGADQYSNEQLLVDELGVGIRVGAGTKKIPDSHELARMFTESIEEKLSQRVKAKKLREAALNAVNGGSSQKDLNDLVKRLNEI